MDMDELKKAESALVDASNALDEAPNGRAEVINLKDIVAHLDAVLGELQRFIRWAERPIDEGYERAPCRDRADGFSRTGGRDWT